MIVFVLITATLLLAWSNGANDNFKGVATLHGGGTLSYRTALLWAAAATLLGGLVSVFLADQLVKTFSGEAILHGGALGPAMLAAMLASAALTVFVASVVGMPTSTSHSLMGALLGVALAVDPGRIRIDRLGALFVGPMLLSPVIAIVAAGLLYLVVRRVHRRMARADAPCLCVGPADVACATTADGALAMGSTATPLFSVQVDTAAACEIHGHGRFLRLDGRGLANVAHGLSGGAVCFARSLNDTPKIAAVLLTTGAVAGVTGGLGHGGILALLVVVVVAGGLLQGRRVARTMSTEITDLDAPSGLSANLVTAGLVLWASRLGLPVSTTHVSCASIFGIGAANRRARGATIGRILLTWVTTLPFAAALGAGLYVLLQAVTTGA